MGTAMVLNRRTAALGGAAALLAAGGAARAQVVPDRPVRLICPWTPGGTVDLYLRGAAPIVARYLGQSLVVENRGGASGSVGTAYLRNQRADGSVIAGVTEVVYRISMVQPVGYDALNDFTFLAGTCTLVWGWAVRRDSPIRDLHDMVERAKARPESVSFAAGGTAANYPFGMKQLEHQTGARFLFVPFSGGGDMINAAMSGNVDLVFDSLGAVAGMIEGGAMRLLAVATPERVARYPDVPTARELGYDAQYSLPTGFIAPRGIPAALAAAYERAFLAAADDPEHAQLIQRLNLVPWKRDARAYEAHVRELYRTLPPLLRELGMLPA